MKYKAAETINKQLISTHRMKFHLGYSHNCLESQLAEAFIT